VARRILVTGATGLVGNNITRQLLAAGIKPRVQMRDKEIPRSFVGLEVDFARGDVCDASFMIRACQGIDCVIHAAGFVHLGRSLMEQHQAVNVEGTRNVARAALAAKVRMIHVSSCDAIGVRSLREPADEETPLAPPIRCNYVLSKRAAEQVVLEEMARGLDVVITNPAFMLGPWDWKPSSGRMLLEVASGRGRLAPRGHFSVCDVRDVAAAIIRSIELGQTGRRYILAGTTMSYLDAWRMFAEITGARKPLGRPGPALFWIGGKLGDLYGKVVGKEPDLNSGAVALAKLPKHYSSARAQRELGYQTRPAVESVRDAWNWFLEYGYARARP